MIFSPLAASLGLREAVHADRYRLPHDRRLCFSGALAFSVLCALLGCSGDSVTTPGLQNSTQVFWALQLNYHAVILAVHDTVRLKVTPLTATGATLMGAEAVRYSSSDSSVTVDSTGLVTARFATHTGQYTQVSAVLSVQGVSLGDTVFIEVTDTTPQHPLTTFSMQPAAGDSAKRAVDFNSGSSEWPVTAIDAAGHTLCSNETCTIPVFYTSSDPSIVSINRATGHLVQAYPGQVTLTATTLAYGVLHRDSVRFTIGYRLSYTIFIGTALQSGGRRVTFEVPKTLQLGVGATVGFADTSFSHPVDVVFDNSAAVVPDSVDSENNNNYFDGVPPEDGGNIPAFGGDTSSYLCDLIGYAPSDCKALGYYNLTYRNFRYRRFPKSGVIRYHSSVLPSDIYTLDIIANP